MIDNFLAFARVALGHDKINVEEHSPLIHSLMTLKFQTLPQRQQIHLYLLPRNSYKTTIATVSFPMWALEDGPNPIQSPDNAILIDSETYGLSKDILSEIKQQYQDGPYSKLVRKVDGKKSDRWAEDSIIVPWRTKPRKEGSINAAGIDGVKAGKHYDIIIADDLHSQHNSKTQAQIDQVIEHYRLILSLLSPHGILIVIGTRWGVGDAYDTIAQDANFQINIPAISLKPHNYGSELGTRKEMVFAYDEVADQATEVTEDCAYFNFPKTLNPEFLADQYKRQKGFLFSAQYLLKPLGMQDQKCKPEWIQYYSVEKDCPIAGEKDFDPGKINYPTGPVYRRLGFVDPSFTVGGDPTGIVIVAVDSVRNIYVIHSKEEKVNPADLIDRLFDLQEQFNVDSWHIEEQSAQKVLSHYLDYRAVHEDKRINVDGVKTYNRSKEKRMFDSLIPFLRNKKIWFPVDGAQVLIDQILRFPYTKHDDLLDALTYVPQVVYDAGKPAIKPVTDAVNSVNELIKAMKKSQGRDTKGIRPRRYHGSGDGFNLNF